MQGVGKPAAEGSYWNTEEEEAKGWPKIRLRMVSNRLENDPGCIHNAFRLAFVRAISRSPPKKHEPYMNPSVSKNKYL